MRACFLGQTVAKLGNGVAILHTPRQKEPEPQKPEDMRRRVSAVVPRRPAPPLPLSA